MTDQDASKKSASSMKDQSTVLNAAAKDAGLRADIESAETAAAMRLAAIAKRKAAPGGRARQRYVDQSREIAEQAVPEAFGPNPTKAVFFGDRAKHRQYVGEGKIPVIIRGEHVTHGGDPLYWYPLEIRQDILERNASDSFERLKKGELLGGAIDEDGKARALTTDELEVSKSS